MEPSLMRIIDVFLEGAKRPLIVIVGPTASGKTALSFEIARHIEPKCEIVNADSRQLYKYLDIGTAKVTLEDTQGIPHHLLSVKDPKEEVTVAWFQEEALRIIDDILSRGKVPLLVGGSMLYVSAITDGLTLGPSPDSALRIRLEEEYDRDGGERLYRRLQTVDPDAAAAIHPSNKPCVVRAMEIYVLLRQPKSLTVKREKCSYDLLLLGVRLKREELLRRITERTEKMLGCHPERAERVEGWVEEVRGLLARGYEASDPGMRSHGYREICQFLRESEGSDGSEGIEDAREKLKQRIIMKTRQYAKRQMTWWRSDSRIRWVSA